MRRFEQEARSAAALNHAHIAHIYEIGEAEGKHFISMEFIDGETLRDKIHREKASLPKLLKCLSQVAAALAKAHERGIVHRDLKPDNIMVTRDGDAKVLDFGLAKLVEPPKPTAGSNAAHSDVATARLSQHSLPGMVMGTVGYMSPEQAQGQVREIDHRSDIFSFGIPGPGSITETVQSLFRSPHRASTLIAPDGVYLIALEIRLCRIIISSSRSETIEGIAAVLAGSKNDENPSCSTVMT